MDRAVHRRHSGGVRLEDLGVANTTTRSGLNSGRRFFGRTEWTVARFEQLAKVTQCGGQTGRSSFQLANLHSQHANGQHQRRQLRDASGPITSVSR
jgi:hypothetical protein